MRRIGDAESDQCPACTTAVETTWQILSCAKRNDWRTTLIKDLKNTLQHTDMQPDLSLMIIQGIRGALLDPNYQMQEEQRKPRFKQIVKEQNQIGWNQLFKGRFSHKWVQCQHIHTQLEPGTDSTQQSGEIWLKRVLNRLWTSTWNVWLSRNDDLHGRDRKQREQKRLEKLIPK
jgi:hypothetical protein